VLLLDTLFVRRKGIILAVALMLLAWGAAACPTWGKLKGNLERTAKLEARLAEIENRQNDIEKKLSELSVTSGKRAAGLGADLDNLAAQVRELRGLVDDIAYKIEQHGLGTTDGTVGGDAETRLAHIERRLGAIEDLLGASPSLPETPPPTGVVSPDQPAGPNYKAAYRKAYALYEAGQYDQARAALEEFVTKFASTDLADNALFWIGECYYRQADYKNAAKNYARVFKEYPKENKVPDAYYKLGLAFWHLGKREAAIACLKKVLVNYPKSYAAPLARRKLQTILSEVPE